MNGGKLLLRSIYACGFVGFAVAAVAASLQPAPDWFAEAVHEGALFVTIATAALWACSELLVHFVRRTGLVWGVIAVALVAVLVPGAYLISAAFHGSSQAEFDTWHLLSLFAVVHQVWAIVVAAVLAGAFAMVLALARFIARTWFPRETRA